MTGYYLKWSVTIVLLVQILLAPFATTLEESLPLVGLIAFTTFVRLLLSWFFDLLSSFDALKRGMQRQKEEGINSGKHVLCVSQDYNRLMTKIRSLFYSIALVLAFMIGFALLVEWGQIWNNFINWIVGLFTAFPWFNN